MNANKLSPAARLLVSLSLVVGILVVDQVNPLFQRAASAHNGERAAVAVPAVPIGTSVGLAEGMVVGPYIRAQQVVVNGVPVDGYFAGGVQVKDGVIVSGEDMSVRGVIVSGEEVEAQGVIVSGELETVSAQGVIVSGEDSDVSAQGVIVSGEVISTDGVIVSGESTLVGGTVVGDNVRIVDGFIHGDNLRLIGATVTGPGLSVSGVAATIGVGKR